MREVLKVFIRLLLILSIPLVATTASADFVDTELGGMQHYPEVIQMIMLGVGLLFFGSYLRTNEK